MFSVLCCAVQVMWSTLWSVVIMHGDLQLCTVLGSASILLGVALVTQSSGMDAAEMQLEEKRLELTIESRIMSGRLTPLDRLMRGMSQPNMWLGRTSKSSLQAYPPVGFGVGENGTSPPRLHRTFTAEF